MAQIFSRICAHILVTGVTGSGKSNTLAAMLDRINSSRPEHIIELKV